MNTNRNPQTGPDFDGDLARFCFETAAATTDRRLAWVNAICLSCLVVGLIGLKPRPIGVIQPPRPAEEAVATVIEPAVIPVQTVIANDNPNDTGEPTDAHSAGPVIAVTLNSPAVAFAVPTVGNVLVPLHLAQAPPVQPLKGAVRLQSAKLESIEATGLDGHRPAPAYPAESLRAQEQGTVRLLIAVDPTGKVSTVTIQESSGYHRLDQAAIEAVKQFWYFGPAHGPRLYESPIVFRLR